MSGVWPLTGAMKLAAYGAAALAGLWLVRRCLKQRKKNKTYRKIPYYAATVPLEPLTPRGEPVIRHFPASAIDHKQSAAAVSAAASADSKLDAAAGYRPDGPPYPARIANTIRVCTWNIERGYELARLIAELRACDADVLMLSEVDIGSARSGRNDTGAEIAKHAKYEWMAFANEILNPGGSIKATDGSKKRTPHPPGCEGMAVLSRYPIVATRAVVLPCVRNKWKPRHDHEKTHVALVATVRTPQFGDIEVMSVHLEAYSGIRGHEQQFTVILNEAVHEWKRAGVPHVIGGDLNTHSHGLARLVPIVANDEMRWKLPLSMTEAEHFQQHMIEKTGSGLVDPFDKRAHNTHQSGSVPTWLYSGKLDWLLTSQQTVKIHQYFMGGAGASDHKLLAADITFTAPNHSAATAASGTATASGTAASAAAKK